MSIMAKKTTPSARSGEPINCWVRTEIMESMRAFLASTRPRVSKTAAVEEALIAFLEARGFAPVLPKEEVD